MGKVCLEIALGGRGRLSVIVQALCDLTIFLEGCYSVMIKVVWCRQNNMYGRCIPVKAKYG